MIVCPSSMPPGAILLNPKVYLMKCHWETLLCDSGVYGQCFILCLSLFLFLVARTSDTESDCLAGVNPCMSVRCQVGEECEINKFGIARCECPTQCEPVMRPVCGEDGRTYESLCEMSRSSCMHKKLIEVKHAGSCGKTTTLQMWSAMPCYYK